jgi:hypothetical protein
MDTPSPQPISCTRRYSQRPKTHFSADALHLLYNFTASTQCELGEVQDGLNRRQVAPERPSRPPSIENDFSRSTSSPAELSSVGLRDNLRMAATVEEGTAPKLSF